jgi:hypothetical protein
MRSNSARFLDRMLCADTTFQHCRRPWEVQAMALAFGWNEGCVEGRNDCGKRDLLFGRARRRERRVRVRCAAPRRSFPTAGCSPEPARQQARRAFRLRRPAPLDLARVQAAPPARTASASATTTGSNAGRGVVDIVAEGWGQGTRDRARSASPG